MTAIRCFKTLQFAALALAVLVSSSWTASAGSEPATSPEPRREQSQQGLESQGDHDRTLEQARDAIRDRIHDRILVAENLSADDRSAMNANLEACLRADVTDDGLETVFPGGGKGRQMSTQTMLQLQTRLRTMAQDGLPLEPALAKVQEALMKGVPDAGLAQVCERVENHVREAKRIMTQAREDGFQPAPDAQRERQMIREMAQQMWRGTEAEDMDRLRTRARERLRTRDCTMEDLVAASETATRLREEGVASRRAMRVAGEALRQGYGADELRRLQYMMVYRHREGRNLGGLVDDFEHCLDAGMDSAHMYQYMMQHGWMGPGDMQGPGGSRPIDDHGHGHGGPGDGGMNGGGGGGNGGGGPGDDGGMGDGPDGGGGPGGPGADGGGTGGGPSTDGGGSGGSGNGEPKSGN